MCDLRKAGSGVKPCKGNLRAIGNSLIWLHDADFFVKAKTAPIFTKFLKANDYDIDTADFIESQGHHKL